MHAESWRNSYQAIATKPPNKALQTVERRAPVSALGGMAVAPLAAERQNR